MGLSDKKIADICALSKYTIRQWRLKNNLEANFNAPCGCRTLKKDEMPEAINDLFNYRKKYHNSEKYKKYYKKYEKRQEVNKKRLKAKKESYKRNKHKTEI